MLYYILNQQQYSTGLNLVKTGRCPLHLVMIFAPSLKTQFTFNFSAFTYYY
jgi:hypothetical protein